MLKVYNKLVRDRIPEIIEADGKRCKTRILSDEEYLRYVDAKLDEELAEYHKDGSIEELADLLEVIRAAAAARGSSIEEVEAIRVRKAEKRGGFEKRILLITVLFIQGGSFFALLTALRLCDNIMMYDYILLSRTR